MKFKCYSRPKSENYQNFPHASNYIESHFKTKYNWKNYKSFILNLENYYNI